MSPKYNILDPNLKNLTDVAEMFAKIYPEEVADLDLMMMPEEDGTTEPDLDGIAELIVWSDSPIGDFYSGSWVWYESAHIDKDWEKLTDYYERNNIPYELVSDEWIEEKDAADYVSRIMSQNVAVGMR